MRALLIFSPTVKLGINRRAIDEPVYTRIARNKAVFSHGVGVRSSSGISTRSCRSGSRCNNTLTKMHFTDCWWSQQSHNQGNTERRWGATKTTYSPTRRALSLATTATMNTDSLSKMQTHPKPTSLKTLWNLLPNKKKNSTYQKFNNYHIKLLDTLETHTRTQDQIKHSRHLSEIYLSTFNSKFLPKLLHFFFSFIIF